MDWASRAKRPQGRQSSGVGAPNRGSHVSPALSSVSARSSKSGRFRLVPSAAKSKPKKVGLVSPQPQSSHQSSSRQTASSSYQSQSSSRANDKKMGRQQKRCPIGANINKSGIIEIAQNSKLRNEIKHVILDAGVFITRQSIVDYFAPNTKYYVTNGVINEINDFASKQYFHNFPLPKIEKIPTPHSRKFVKGWIAKNSQFRELSSVDRDVIALSHQIEIETNGDQNITSSSNIDKKKETTDIDDNVSVVTHSRRHDMQKPLPDTGYRVVTTKRIVPFVVQDFFTLDKTQYGTKHGRPVDWEALMAEGAAMTTKEEEEKKAEMPEDQDQPAEEKKMEDTPTHAIVPGEAPVQEEEPEELTETPEKKKKTRRGARSKKKNAPADAPTNAPSTEVDDVAVFGDWSGASQVTAFDAWEGEWATPENYKTVKRDPTRRIVKNEKLHDATAPAKGDNKKTAPSKSSVVCITMDVRLQECLVSMGLRALTLRSDRISKINTQTGGYRDGEVLIAQYIECSVCHWKYNDMNVDRINCTANCGNDLLNVVKKYRQSTGRIRTYSRRLHSRKEEKRTNRAQYHLNQYQKRNKNKRRPGAGPKGGGGSGYGRKRNQRQKISSGWVG